jgi:signal transduction histidine kinase/CheY-like chemotaxis protein
MKKLLMRQVIPLLAFILVFLSSAGIVLSHGSEETEGVNSAAEPVKWDLKNKGLDHIGVSETFMHASYSGRVGKSAVLEDLKGAKISPDIITGIEMMLMGCLVFAAIYNLSLFHRLRKGSAYASFGALCLLSCICITFSSRLHIHWLASGMDLETVKKIEFTAYALFVPLCVTYIRGLFEEEFKSAIVNVIWAAGIISSVLIVTTPHLYIRIMVFFSLLSFAIFVYTFVMVLFSAMKKRKGSYIMLSGLATGCLGAACYILFRLGLVKTGGMALLGGAAFLLLQVYLVSCRFIDSYRKEIIFNRDLNRKYNELEKSKTLLNCIFDSLSSSLVAVDSSKVITFLNASARKCPPGSGTDMTGRMLWEMIPVRDEYKNTLEDVIKTGKQADLRNEQIMKDDDRFFNIGISHLIDTGSSGAIILADDVTEIYSNEEQVKQSQMMEIISLLAAGLAHDFNKALGGILSTATLMKYLIAEGIEDNRVPERVSAIEKAAKKASDLVGRFLHLTRKQDVLHVPVDLNSAVQHVVKICRDTFDKTVKINAGYLMDDAFILADELQVEHVLLNLCMNASQAMTVMRGSDEVPGGILDISIGSIGPGDDFFTTHEGIKPDDFWTVSVSDTGVGIDSDRLGKIFEPFFSTRQAGTGLGLVMAEGIVKQHGGFIGVRSVKGKGSVFTVGFKKHFAAIVTPAAYTTASESVEGGEGIILLAEDDNIIRDIAREFLEENGYRVISAENGEEALSIFRQRSYEIKGVFMDAGMPVMSGRDAFNAMKEFDPDVKVLLTSGFAYEPAVKDAIDKGVKGFLRKPYSMHELLAKVREVFG